MTLCEFRELVAAFMQRPESAFIVGSTNLLTHSANMARRWAERQRNFELCKVSAYLPSVSLTNGASLSGTVLYSDKATAVSTKNVLKAYVELSSNMIPVDLVSHEKFTTEKQRYFDQIYVPNTTTIVPTYSSSFIQVVRWGDTIYVTPADATALGGDTVNVGLDIVKWLAPYVNDSDTDFFLDHCEDFMLFRAVSFLNLQLKEDQRVPLTKKELEDSWQTVVAWDSSLISNAAEDASLE